MFSFGLPRGSALLPFLPPAIVVVVVVAVLAAPGPESGPESVLPPPPPQLEPSAGTAANHTPPPSGPRDRVDATLRVIVDDGTGRSLDGVLIRIRPADDDRPETYAGAPWRKLGWTTDRGFLLPLPDADFELQFSADDHVGRQLFVPRGHFGDLRVTLPPAPVDGAVRVVARILPEGSFLRQVRCRLVWVDPVGIDSPVSPARLARFADLGSLPWSAGPLLTPNEDGLVDTRLDLRRIGAGFAARFEVWCDDVWPQPPAGIPDSAGRLWVSEMHRPAAGEVWVVGARSFQHILRLRAWIAPREEPLEDLEWLLLTPSRRASKRGQVQLRIADQGRWPEQGALNQPLTPGLRGQPGRLLLLRDLTWSLTGTAVLRAGFNEFGTLTVPDGPAVSGLVLNGFGEPVEGLAVRILGWAPLLDLDLAAEFSDRTVARSGADGRFRFPRVQPGSYRLMLEPPDEPVYGPLPERRAKQLNLGREDVPDLVFRTEGAIQEWRLRLELPAGWPDPPAAAALARGTAELVFLDPVIPADSRPPPQPWSEDGVSWRVYPGAEAWASFGLDCGPELPWIEALADHVDNGAEIQELVLRPVSPPILIQGPPEAGHGTVYLRPRAPTRDERKQEALRLLRRRRSTEDPEEKQLLDAQLKDLLRQRIPQDRTEELRLDDQAQRLLVGFTPGHYTLTFRDAKRRPVGSQDLTIAPTPAAAADHPWVSADD